MADAFTWFIRFVHIFSGVMWLGGSFLWGMLIAPAVLRNGPPMIRRPFLEAVLARFTRYMILSSSLTILSGFWVMGLIVGWDGIADTFQAGSYGIALGIGVVAALLMYAEGWLVIVPTGKKLLQAMQAMPAPVPGQPSQGPSPAGAGYGAGPSPAGAGYGAGPSPAGAGSSPAPPAEIAALGKKLGIAGLTSMILGTIALAGMVWVVNVVR